ncbi:MAG: hypothetical protein FWC66_08685 [Oscillospiraceae bacterium]|nr:hypothetical protein [Oscillospiraceae bacterium]
MSLQPKGRSALAKVNKKHLIGIAVVFAVVIVAVVVIITQPFDGISKLPEIREVFTLHDTYNMAVVVTFDEEPPVVQFIAPDGSYVDMDNIRYRHGGNFIQYFLPNAMPGVWRMAYDPLSNSEITTPYAVYMTHIFIQNFDADIAEENDGSIPVTFEVSADDAGEFRYELHAVFTAPDNSIADEILMVKGYGVLNESLTLIVDVGELRDMGGFMLRLTAYVQHGQAAIRDTTWLDLRSNYAKFND